MFIRARVTPSSLPSCLTGYYVQVVLIMFFLFSSDIFITLRCVRGDMPVFRLADTPSS